VAVAAGGPPRAALPEGRTLAGGGEPAWKASAELLALPPNLLPELHALRLSRSTPARSVITAQYEQVLEILRRLSEEVDRW